MRILFASDLHLHRDRLEGVAAFARFLRSDVARGADEFHLLGDVFDQWLGDDDTHPPHPEVEAELRALVDAGVRVGFIVGNHDFLVGAEFAARTGVELLDEVTVLDLAGRRTLITHGDQLCTGDVDYQAFRVQARDPETQRAFLALPLETRNQVATGLRHQSKELTALKPSDITDVAPDAVEALLREYEADDLIHGHTHRPATHELTVDGRACRRIVLSDWYETPAVLCVEDDRYETLPVPLAAPSSSGATG